jgi:hypothetical protein
MQTARQKAVMYEMGLMSIMKSWVVVRSECPAFTMSRFIRLV